MDFKTINLPLIQGSTRAAAEFQAGILFYYVPVYQFIIYLMDFSLSYMLNFSSALFSGSSALSCNCIQTSCSRRCCKLMMIRTTQLAHNCNSWDRLIVLTLFIVNIIFFSCHLSFSTTACWKRETQWGRWNVSKKGPSSTLEDKSIHHAGRQHCEVNLVWLIRSCNSKNEEEKHFH